MQSFLTFLCVRPLVLLKRSVVACTVGFYDRLTFVGLTQIWCSQAVQHFGCPVMFSISDDPSIFGGQPADVERGFMRSNASWRWKRVYLGLYHSSPFSISLSSTIIIDVHIHSLLFLQYCNAQCIQSGLACGVSY